MNIAEKYEATLIETLELQSNLQKEYDYNSKVYQTLKTDNATPDIPLLDFLTESIPDWTKVLTTNIVVEIIKYSTAPSEDAKNKLMQYFLERNKEIIYKIREINFTLNDCTFEIEEKISECNIKIEELLKQIEGITTRIGKLETTKAKWVEIKKKL